MNLNFVDIVHVEPDVQELVRQWRNSPQVRTWMVNQQMITPQIHHDWLKNLQANHKTKFWVVYVQGVALGAAYLQNINHDLKETEWGFYIGRSEYRGKGLGSHILYRLLEIVFKDMKFRRLVTKVLSNNTAAMNIYQKFNFKEYQRQRIDKDREIVMLECYAVEWDEIKERIFDRG